MGSGETRQEALGWKVATFGLERLAPEKDYVAGSSAIWDAYCSWCKGRKEVPLAFAVFHAEFDKVARAAGIRAKQVGGHILYQDTRLVKETSA